MKKATPFRSSKSKNTATLRQTIKKVIMHEELKLKCQVYPYPLGDDGMLATSGPILPRNEDIPIVINSHDIQIYHAGEMIRFNKEVVTKLLELIKSGK